MSATLTSAPREPHPVVAMLPPELERQLPPEKVEEFYGLRAEAIALAAQNPLIHGYELEKWKLADRYMADFRKRYPIGVLTELDLGGNRAAKSERRAKRLVENMVQHPGWKAWACQATQTASRQNQQSIIYKYLPPEWKPESGKLRSGAVTKIVYTQAGGFTEDVLVCPNGSECRFKFYSMAVGSLEGAELDEGWCFIAGTQILTPHGEVPIETLQPGDDVITRRGARAIAATNQRRAPVGRVTFSNGRELTGTANHLVFTTNHGWTRMDELEAGDQVCATNVSSGMEGNGIPMPVATTTPAGIEPKRTYTARFGASILARSPGGMMSTIGTGTFSIIPSRTCNVYRSQSICAGTCAPAHGRKWIGRARSLSMSPAPTVGLTLKGNAARRSRSVSPACLSGRSESGRRNGRSNAECAAESLTAGWETFVASVVSTWAAVGPRTVYNLQVTETPEYFANGILVHNCDELVPPDWIEALIFRLVTRNGLLGITFTPIEGYSPTVKAHLNGATTLLEAEASLLPVRDAAGEIIGHEKVPVVQENLRVEIEGQKSKALIFYFHTADNPFGNFDSMAATLEGASREKILTRAYGVPTKAALTRFPLFSDIVHVVSLNRFQEIQRAGGTWYHFLDPCSGRNWFQIWVFIDPLNRIFIRAESPSHGHAEAYIPGVGDPGPWAVAGNKADGNQGEGQKEWGWGYARYIEEMGRIESLLVAPGRDDSGKQESRKEEISKTEPMRLSTALAEAKAARAPEGPGRPEDKPLMRNPRGPDEARPIGHTASAALSPFLASLPRVPVYERWIDARYGNARRTQEESSTTLIDDLEAAGMRFLAAPSEHAIDSGRGGGDGSLRMINAALYYDKKRPVDHTNEPRLYVCESCPNVIYALKEWTGQDGQHGASKDPIDCLRMLVLSDVRYVNEALLAPKVPWLGMRR